MDPPVVPALQSTRNLYSEKKTPHKEQLVQDLQMSFERCVRVSFSSLSRGGQKHWSFKAATFEYSTMAIQK